MGRGNNMAKSTAQINKEATSAPLEDSPAVIAYRMGQLENAVKAGFEKHDKKLDSLTSNFATKEELAVVQSRLNDYQWYFRALAVAVFTALAGVVINWIGRK